jgi:hypothetical protein
MLARPSSTLSAGIADTASHTISIVRITVTVNIHRLEPGTEYSHRTTLESKKLDNSPEATLEKLHQNEGVRSSHHSYRASA